MKKQMYKRTGICGLFDLEENTTKYMTVWVFRNQLTQKNLFEKLFDDFYELLKTNNLIVNQSIISDGSFVEVSRQRNTHGENKAINEGKGSEL